MNIHVPNPLRSHTHRRAIITAKGRTLEAVLNDIEGQFPGFRLRIVNERNTIREHIKIFVGEQQIQDLNAPLAGFGVHIHHLCFKRWARRLSGCSDFRVGTRFPIECQRSEDQ